MNHLEIKFGTFIDNYDVDSVFRRSGPLFHRWLPNGRDDALKVELTDEKAYVLLWFERRGYVDDSGFIKYEHKKKEVDDTIIPRQAVLGAGALFGCVVLNDVIAEEYECVINDKTDAAGYIAIGKRVVKKIVDPLLAKITRILRDTYGQYWVEIPSCFDSRKSSLGQHCHHRSMKWQTLDGKEGFFIPTEKKNEVISINVGMSSYDEYLDKETWEIIGELLNSNYQPSTTLAIASRVNRLLDEGRIQHALIECITSLEVAIEEYVRIKLQNDTKFIEVTQSFWQLSLPARVTLVATLACLDDQDINNSLKAISERNKFVHEGKSPAPESENYIKGVLQIIKGFAGTPQVKLPTANHSNELRKSPDDWNNKKKA